MGKIDVAILDAMATAISVSAQEYSDAKGTAQENACLVKMNFIKQFAEDVYFLNDYSEHEHFSRRYGNLIIRDMLEQLIEFLYLQKHPDLADEYLGLKVDFDALGRKTSIVEKEKLFGDKRYLNVRPPVWEMAKEIGEKSAGEGKLTLYKLYQILSEHCHNSYFSAFLDDINKSCLGVSAYGLSDSQVNDLHIMILYVLEEYGKQ